MFGAWDAISEIKTDRLGKLYFSHSNGISTKTQFLINTGRASDLAFDKQNRLWYVADDWQTGLWMYDGTNLFRWTKDNGLISPLSQVRDVAVDSNNNIWIANSSYWYDLYGVSKFDGHNFTHFNVQDGLGHGSVYDIYVDRKGDIWFGTSAGGVSVLHDTTITKVNRIPEPNAIFRTFVLYQNYPNPFNSQTCLRYNLNASGKVKLAIYNLVGKEVRTLVNEHQTAGEHETFWDGTDHSGKEVTSGIYIAVLSNLHVKQSIKISLIR